MPERYSSENFEYSLNPENPDFVDFFNKIIIPDLNDILDSPRLFLGPTYSGVTSRNEVVKINIFGEINEMQDFPDNFYIVMAGTTGEILGARYMIEQEQERESGHFLNLGGRIVLAKKNQGLAIPLEIANMDMLQRISNRINNQVEWKTEDINGAELQKMKESRPSSLEEIKLFEAEHERWLKVYGEKGFVGATPFTSKDYPQIKMYKKIFLPMDDAINLDNICSVSFERTDSSNGYKAEPQIFDSLEQKTRVLKARQAGLVSLINLRSDYE